MIDKTDTNLSQYAGIIEAGLGEFVEELRSIDLVDLVSFIRFESYPTVEDLVNSSTELFFRAGTMMFSWAACVDLKWDALPVVTLGLEFRHPVVTAFFNLTIRDGDQVVEVLGINFERTPLAPREILARAIADARLGPSPTRPLPTIARFPSRGIRRDLPLR